jgi:hypothetical protein
MSGGVWLASYAVLWAAVLVLLVTMLALLRQIGVLHERLAAAGEGAEAVGCGVGPAVGEAAPMPGRLGYARSAVTVVAFTAPTCSRSRALVPSLRAVDQQYDEVRVVEVSRGPRTAGAFEAFGVASTPFVVAVGRDGRVRDRGRVRTMAQLEDLLTRALAVGEPETQVVVPVPSVPAAAPAAEAEAGAPEPDGGAGDAPPEPARASA